MPELLENRGDIHRDFQHACQHAILVQGHDHIQREDPGTGIKAQNIGPPFVFSECRAVLPPFLVRLIEIAGFSGGRHQAAERIRDQHLSHLGMQRAKAPEALRAGIGQHVVQGAVAWHQRWPEIFDLACLACHLIRRPLRVPAVSLGNEPEHRRVGDQPRLKHLAQFVGRMIERSSQIDGLHLVEFPALFEEMPESRSLENRQSCQKRQHGGYQQGDHEFAPQSDAGKSHPG